jgi:hypothetical protein
MREWPDPVGGLGGHGGPPVIFFPRNDTDVDDYRCGVDDPTETSGDEATGMSVDDLLTNDDPRSLEEVLAEINTVLGEIDGDQAESCCTDESTCDHHYDMESMALAEGVMRGRGVDAAIRAWTVDTFVRFRREAINGDSLVRISPDEWLAEHSLDEIEARHVELECARGCPVCAGEEPYRSRIYRLQPPKPRGWTRFVDFAGHVEITDADGTILIPFDPRPVEANLRDMGFGEDEIAHATGGCGSTCSLCRHWNEAQQEG